MNDKAIIFDCFGVLYPSYADGFYEKHEDFLVKNTALLDRINLEIDLGKIMRAGFYEQLGDAMGIAPAELQAEMEMNIVADKNLVRFIEQLKENYKIGLLSNAGSEEIAIIYRDKLDGLFDAITVSYEVGDVKPNILIYEACLDRLGVPPDECIFVDDNLVNLEVAQRLGINTIHYPSFGTIPDSLKSLI